MRNTIMRVTARAAVLGASAALVATAAPAAFAAEPAARNNSCVLKAGGGIDCGAAAAQSAARGPWAIKVHQHPDYKGGELTLHLPKGVKRCSGPFDREYLVDLAHNHPLDNRISSVQSNDATKCNIQMYDGHRFQANKKGHTGFADHCRRLSRPSTCVYHTAPKNKPFDNVTSSFIIS